MRVANLYVFLPRHPLLRALALVAAAIALVGLLAMSLVVGAIAVAAAALTLLARRWLGRRSRQRHAPDFIEGEFIVVPPQPSTGLPRIEQA